MESRADLKDEDLVARCREGDKQAFGVLVQRYMKKAFGIAFDYTRDREAAKDLSQEAFLRAYLQIKRFDGRSTFYTWFYRIVVNLSLDYLRRRGRARWERFDETAENPAERAPMVDSSTPDRVLMAQETVLRVARAVETLPTSHRTAFLLRNHQGLSIPDIARVMKTTDGTVRVFLHRAVAALRQTLAEIA